MFQEFVKRPYLRLHVKTFVCLRQSLSIGSDEGAPWSRARGFQAIPYSGSFVTPTRSLSRPTVGMWEDHFLAA